MIARLSLIEKLALAAGVVGIALTLAGSVYMLRTLIKRHNATYPLVYQVARERRTCYFNDHQIDCGTVGSSNYFYVGRVSCGPTRLSEESFRTVGMAIRARDGQIARQDRKLTPETRKAYCGEARSR